MTQSETETSQNPLPSSFDENRENLPVLRTEYAVTLGQLGGLTTKVDLMWEEIKKTASAETVEKVEKVQKQHTIQIAGLETNMSTVKEKQDQIWWLSPIVTLYQKVVKRLTVIEVVLIGIVALLLGVGGVGYWLTQGGGLERMNKQDEQTAIRRDSVEHAHAMDMMRLQIEFQEATRRAPTNITVEQDGRVVSSSSERSDSLPANFGVDAPLYPPQSIDAP